MTTLLTQILAAGIGTVAFGAIFGVPTRYYPYCGVIGGAGWAVYVVLWQMLELWSEPYVVFFATMLVILLSRFFAVLERCPVTIFLISGILPLVPGAGIYWTSYYVVTNQLEEASRRGFLALKVAVAIVLGIVIVFEIPQGFFRAAVGAIAGKREKS
ncbi:MAG: threonine/serine exporter family protein [Eubacteriales bacterium]|nr:threonine/serine exporter family protein [Eubacteriales bacterium]